MRRLLLCRSFGLGGTTGWITGKRRKLDVEIGRIRGRWAKSGSFRFLLGHRFRTLGVEGAARFFRAGEFGATVGADGRREGTGGRRIH